MTDAFRKDATSQIGEKVKPDSQKSTLEKGQETITGLGDRAAGAVQPEGEKSTGQKVTDSTRSGKDEASNQGSGVLDSAGNAINSATESVKNTLGGNSK